MDPRRIVLHRSTVGAAATTLCLSLAAVPFATARADDAPAPGAGDAVGGAARSAGGGAQTPPSDARSTIRRRSEAATAWQMTMTPGPMRLFVDSRDGTPYWYFTYKVVNNTGQDLRFAPKFELVDDEGRIAVSGDGVPSEVSRLLLRQLNNPLIEDQNQILGDILQGEGNAKEGIVVFRVTQLGSKELFLFVSNLSSERRIVRNAKGEDSEVRRQYRIAFSVPGDAVPRGSTALDLLEEGKEPNPRWEWR